MHRLLDNTLHSLRQDLDSHLPPSTIDRVCRQVGHKWRICQLVPSVLIRLFLIQILHGNTALNHLSILAGRCFTASAYCQARGRLPLQVLLLLLSELVKTLTADDTEAGLWNGHRTLLADGSSFSTADTPELQKQFGQPGAQRPGCGFPVAKILALFDAKTGFLLSVHATPLRTHEMSQVDVAHEMIRPGDVLVGDRGLSSYVHLALLAARQAHGVFRLHQKQIVDFTPSRPHGPSKTVKGQPTSRWVRSLGPNDQVVEYFRPKSRPKWMTEQRYAALPESMLLRELRYTVSQPGHRTKQITLVTTLLDPEKYSAASLADLYGMRWRVEQNLRDLKQTMKMDVLRCQSVDGVLKELTAYAIVYNLIRLVMVKAGHRQGFAPDRISFIDAMRWLIQAKPGDEVPRLIVNPLRENRFEPRARKRRPKQYDLMKKSRAELRERLIAQAVKA